VVVKFIDDHKGRFGVEPICRVLTEYGCKVAPSTYYAVKKRPPSARSVRDGKVLVEVERVHKAARGGLYGAEKVYRQLAREHVTVDGSSVARCTVERLMRVNGLVGVTRRRKMRTTIADPAAARPADLVKRDFTADAPDRLWVVDFTYVATMAGWAYVAFVIDVFSRMIVGWRVARHMRTDMPLDALEMALASRYRAGRNTSGLVHHSDAGCQYTSIRYTTRLEETGLSASIGSVGDSYDNALAETLNGLYKAECVFWEGPWAGADDLELATLSWVHWFNNERIHSALGWLPPAEYEQNYYDRQTTPDKQPLAG